MVKSTLSPREWRKSEEMSMADVTTVLGMRGKNPARTWQRWETGAQQPPLEIVIRVEVLSKGRVTLASWVEIWGLHRESLGQQVPA